MAHSKRILAAMLVLGGIATGAAAHDSVYTKLDLETCVKLDEYALGVSLMCAGHSGFGVLFQEGDIRHSVHFGHIGNQFKTSQFESFGSFNNVGDTIEWRLNEERVPIAAILRWHISNPEAEGDQSKEGQVLVVSKVGQPGVGEACVAGYVDARANANANELARQVADGLIVNGFSCGIDQPIFHGERGSSASDPTNYLE